MNFKTPVWREIVIDLLLSAEPALIHFMHPVFMQYAHSAPRWCREVVLNAVDLLLPRPVIKIKNAPSSLLALVNVQVEMNRYVVHLLHYIPGRRGSSSDTIEDGVPVYNQEISLNLPRKVQKVSAVPQGKNILFRQKEDTCIFTLPELYGHQVIEVLC